jgi:hypothetical protein
MDFDEFEHEGKFAYDAFANIVVDIMGAAIDTEGSYRLQQIQRRAKSPAPLSKKLEIRKITDGCSGARNWQGNHGSLGILFYKGDSQCPLARVLWLKLQY